VATEPMATVGAPFACISSHLTGTPHAARPADSGHMDTATSARTGGLRAATPLALTIGTDGEGLGRASDEASDRTQDSKFSRQSGRRETFHLAAFMTHFELPRLLSGARSDWRGSIHERKEIPMSEREPCCFCGDRNWTDAHYSAGRLLCQVCWAGRTPAVAMPCTAAQQTQLADWLAPRMPAEDRTLNQGELAQPQGPFRG
jgi:hypothetical protein